MKIIILDDYQSASASYSWPAHLEITVLNDPIPPADLVATLLPFNIICAMRERTKITADVVNALPNLKLIATTGMRNRGIDLAACGAKNVLVCGTLSPANAASGTVEQTWGLILAISRRIVLEDKSMRVGGFQTGIATGLQGKTIGIVGLGRLGTQVAKVALAFGLKVIAWSPNLTEERAAAAGAQLVPLNTLLSTSDVVSLHIILSETTRGMLSAAELSLLKPTSILVNTSRGALIDEPAMIEMLAEKRILGVGLDVYDVEPLPKDHVLRSMDNVVLAPHMGYVDDISYDSWWPQTIENITSFLDGKPLRVLEAEKQGVF